jgi:hypothetical protein
MKGTFNQGWWNCFESFATVLHYNSNGESLCMGILEGAGITKREATAFINKAEYHDPDVVELVRNYMLKLNN